MCIHCEEKEEEADEEKGVRAPPARRPSLRRLQRNYHLPKDVDPKTIHSEITKKGVIRVTALKRYIV